MQTLLQDIRYAMRTMRDGAEAEIAGGFKYGLTNDFQKLLSTSGKLRVVHLDSIGGRVGEAIALNEVIRANGLDTYVSSKCMSACTIAFAGGTRRILRKGAVLGFHAASFPGMTKEGIAAESKSQKSIFLAAGFDPLHYAPLTVANMPSGIRRQFWSRLARWPW